MRKTFTLLALIFSLSVAIAQEETTSEYNNIATSLMEKDSKLTIGGYGEVHYNQALGGDVRNNGNLDVHRMVMLFGYKFNDRTNFITELEFEHVKEVYVEQAFLDYRINQFMNFRAGLMLVPMGLVNEYHEPTTFNGVERPLIDGKVAPTTWREIGFGLSGNIASASFKYQAYVMNGFNGYAAGAGTFRGKDGFRKGRQKGAESYISSPTLALRAEHYGLRGLNVGLSGYFGKSQSELFGGLDTSKDTLLAQADSSVVNIAMIGVDFRYVLSGLQVKGQFYYATVGNTKQYNEFTGKDIGSAMLGYYAEVGYNVFQNTSFDSELIPFIRYSNYNNHASVEGITSNDAYNNNVITGGLGWKMAKGAMLKADMQFIKAKGDKEFTKSFNAGVAVMF